MPAGRTARAVFAALLATSLLAACGDDGGGDEGVGTGPGSGSGSTPGKTTAPAQGGGPIELITHDNVFKPDTLDVQEGQEVRVSMKNTGVAPHNFKSDDLGVDVDVQAGKTVEFSFTPDQAGEFKFICKYHETVGMVGTVVVS